MNHSNFSSSRKKDLAQAIPEFSHINRYWDKHADISAAKILPGEFYVTAHDEMIVTVLGSCVSACIRDKVFGIGGMNHFMLPMSGENLSSPDSKWASEANRYGNFAMEALINEILKNGGRKENLEVKLFGGGKVLENATSVGDRNIDFVKDFVRTEGLKVLAEDLGDTCPRKVHYFPVTGKVQLKKLRSKHSDTIASRERQYRHTLNTQPIEGEIDLF